MKVSPASEVSLYCGPPPPAPERNILHSLLRYYWVVKPLLSRFPSLGGERERDGWGLFSGWAPNIFLEGDEFNSPDPDVVHCCMPDVDVHWCSYITFDNFNGLPGFIIMYILADHGGDHLIVNVCPIQGTCLAHRGSRVGVRKNS